MITVTSAEKNKIEGQMKTALPFINNNVDFEIAIMDGNKKRSRLTFKKDEVEYQLPIFYVTPSTDDSTWEMLTDHIEDEKDCQGIFIVKFNADEHLIHNAETCALTYHELYEKNALSEMCRLCSYFDFDPYKIQLFDPAEVKVFFDKLGAKPEVQTKVDESDISSIENLIKELAGVSFEKTNVVEEKKSEITEPEIKEPETKEFEVKKPEVKKSEIKKPEVKVETPVTTEEDLKLDSDIRALINDCFGLF